MWYVDTRQPPSPQRKQGANVPYLPRLELLEERLVLSEFIEISGNASVQAGQIYTLQVFTILEFPLVIDWGDTTTEEIFPQQQQTEYFHVYAEGPNAYIIEVGPGESGSVQIASDYVDTLLVTVTTEDISQGTSTIINPGETASLSIPNAIDATVNRAATGTEPMLLLLAVYQSNPVAGTTPSVVTQGGRTLIQAPLGLSLEIISYDVQATIPEAGDSAVVRFTIPDGAFLVDLLFFNTATNTYMRVMGSTKVANSLIRVGNTFQIVFDDTSFPTFFQLRGTVFTITDAQALLPGLLALAQAPSAPLSNSNDILGSLLRSGAEAGPDSGSSVGVVAPSQVSAFQGITGFGEDAEGGEQARIARQLMRLMDSLYQQMRNILTPQLYLDVNYQFEPVLFGPIVVDKSQSCESEDRPFGGALQGDPYAAAPIATETRHASPGDSIGSAELVPFRWASLWTEKALACLALAGLPFVPWMDRASRPERREELARS